MIRASLLVIAATAFISACASAGSMSEQSSSANKVTATTDASIRDAEFTTLNSNTAVISAGAPVELAQDATEQETPAAKKVSLAKAEETFASERKVIRNAELDLEAEVPEEAQRQITSIAELRGGFVVESQQRGSEVTSTSHEIVTITVRVPSEKFAETLADIRNVSSRVVLETVKGQDVTEEFLDIQAQLKAKKALELQFMEIMKRANTVGEALNVQAHLASVRGEIERIEGRMRFLENQSSLSTIRVRVQTAKVFAAAASEGLRDRLSGSFMAGADVAINFILGVVTVVTAVLPFALLVGLPVFLGFRYVWKRQTAERSELDLAEKEFKRT